MTIVYITRTPVLGFAAVDRDLLSAVTEVVEVAYPGRPSLRFVAELWRAAGRAEAGYTFFASEHAVLAGVVLRARRRGFVIAVGGYDTADDAVHRYGLSAQGKGWVPKLACRLATRLVAHSQFALEELARLSPAAARKATVAHLAIDVSRWIDPGAERLARQVVTVGKVTPESYRRKGIDRFVALARRDPTRTYVLAGVVDPSVRAQLDPVPENLRLTGALDRDQLRHLLWSSAVYAQLSWHETFGAAVAEGMACGCVPFVSEQPALLEITGEHAVVLPADGDGAAVLDRVAAAQVDRAGLRAFVADRFAPEARTEALRRALDVNRPS